MVIPPNRKSRREDQLDRVYKTTREKYEAAIKDIRDEGAVTLLFNEKAAQFAKRAGGYTRIVRLGRVGKRASWPAGSGPRC